MRIYSVHIRRGGLDPDRDIVLVKEGFSWSAALFAPAWALWRGLWASAAVMLLSLGGLIALATGLGGAGMAMGWVLVGFSSVVGFLANDLYRGSLERRGFVLQDIVAAPNRDGAEYRFFDRNPAIAADVAGAAGVVGAASI